MTWRSSVAEFRWATYEELDTLMDPNTPSAHVTPSATAEPLRSAPTTAQPWAGRLAVHLAAVQAHRRCIRHHLPV